MQTSITIEPQVTIIPRSEMHLHNVDGTFSGRKVFIHKNLLRIEETVKILFLIIVVGRLLLPISPFLFTVVCMHVYTLPSLFMLFIFCKTLSKYLKHIAPYEAYLEYQANAQAQEHPESSIQYIRLMSKAKKTEMLARIEHDYDAYLIDRLTHYLPADPDIAAQFANGILNSDVKTSQEQRITAAREAIAPDIALTQQALSKEDLIEGLSLAQQIEHPELKARCIIQILTRSYQALEIKKDDLLESLNNRSETEPCILDCRHPDLIWIKNYKSAGKEAINHLGDRKEYWTNRFSEIIDSIVYIIINVTSIKHNWVYKTHLNRSELNYIKELKACGSANFQISHNIMTLIEQGDKRLEEEDNPSTPKKQHAIPTSLLSPLSPNSLLLSPGSQEQLLQIKEFQQTLRAHKVPSSNL